MQDERARIWIVAALCLGAAVLPFMSHAALAQAFRHPFAVGAQEGAVGRVSGLSAWIIGQESAFYQSLAHALAAAKGSGLALLGLLGLGFGYGVFHAAGPGHGKAVITSYMVSNEQALWRGLVISALAALLQGLVAIVVIGCAALIFNATAQKMTATTHVLELAAYCGIVLLGLVLVWRKGTDALTTVRSMVGDAAQKFAAAPELATQPAVMRVFASTAEDAAGARRATVFRATGTQAEAVASAHDEACGPQCGHVLTFDPSWRSDSFSWKSAAVTIVTAGARPCSGAILVLVFSLAQGIFPIGIAAVFAMAAGTALTTAGLAITAVFGKRLAVRLADKGQSRRAQLMAQLVELGAAVCVLLFGAALLIASWGGVLTTA